MDLQTAFDIAFAGFGFVVGWLMKIIYATVQDLQVSDKDLTNKVQSIELLVAGQYIKRTEFESKIDALFAKLDHIEEKLDRKMSRQ